MTEFRFFMQMSKRFTVRNTKTSLRNCFCYGFYHILTSKILIGIGMKKQPRNVNAFIYIIQVIYLYFNYFLPSRCRKHDG